MTRILNGAVGVVGTFVVGLSVVGTSDAINSASAIGGAAANPAAYAAVDAAEKNARNLWNYCRIASGTIILLTVAIDRRIARAGPRLAAKYPAARP